MAEIVTSSGAMSTQTTSRAWATTEEDWSRHQALISDLYSQDKLEKVKEIMEQQHNFKAT